MSTVCAQTPTQTRTITTSSASSSVSFITTFTTIPEPPITSTFSTCLQGTASSVACIPTTITTTIQGDGVQAVATTIPVTAIIDAIVTQTTTLSGSSCSVVNGGVKNTPGVPPPVVNTTPYTTVVSVSGSASVVTVTPTIAAAQATGTSSHKFPIGAVVGGVVGGLALLGGVAFIAYKVIAKKAGKSKFDHDFEDDEGSVGKPDLYAADTAGQNLPPLQPGAPTSYAAPQGQGQGQYQQAQGPEMQQYNLGQQQPVMQPGQDGNTYMTGIEQQQQSPGYQYDSPNNIPQSLQNKLAEQINDYMGAGRPTSSSNQHSPPPSVPHGSPPPGISSMAGVGAAGYTASHGSPPPGHSAHLTGGYPQQQQQQQQQYPQYPQAGYAPAASPPPGFMPAVDPNLGYAPPPMDGQYQQSQVAGQYKGYAEPTRGLPNTQ